MIYVVIKKTIRRYYNDSDEISHLLSSEEGQFEISPSSGEFTRADSVLLNLTFTAKSCKPSRGTYTFTGKVVTGNLICIISWHVVLL